MLGFDSVEGYQNTPGYLGALVGRYANRIASAYFELNGRGYHLAKNDGDNHLHGGERGFPTGCGMHWSREMRPLP